ncbi:relaxase/mobilization nuclease domain-containing protein [Aeromonas veronii]|uniref:relaxase/mobilization nuclease domain-containing protein n=1 Tax=Aeromonas veronii TaxID=654 RepID=UPI003D1D0CC7
MKAKITKQKVSGKSRTALQLLRYLSDTKEKGAGLKCAELIYCNIPEMDPVNQAKALNDMQKLRRNCNNHIYQISLSLPIGDDISDEMWQRLAIDFLEEMGLEPTNRPVVSFRHHDTEHQHIHIATSRIGYDGSLWSDSRDVYKAIEITQRLEIRYGLTITKGFSKKDVKSLTKNEIEMSMRTNELAPRAVIQQAIDLALGEKVTVHAFIERLEEVGITAKPNCTNTTFNGFSFEYNGVPFKGSSLGKKYTLKNLISRGLQYEQKRDIELLNERKKAINSQDNRIYERVSDEAAGGTGINPTSPHGDYREPGSNQDRDRGIEARLRESAGAGQPDNGTGRADERCNRTAGAGRCDERGDGFAPVGCREQDQKIRIEVGKTDHGGSAEKIQERANLSDRTTAHDAANRATASTAKAHILDTASAERMCLTMLKEDDYSRQQIKQALVECGHSDSDTAWIILRAIRALEHERGVNPRSEVLKGL